jgi:hypothetical protein
VRIRGKSNDVTQIKGSINYTLREHIANEEKEERMAREAEQLRIQEQIERYREEKKRRKLMIEEEEAMRREEEERERQIKDRRRRKYIEEQKRKLNDY